MGDHVPCAYCLELPPLDRARKGKLHRCPLCKTEILETGTDVSYRLRSDDGEEIHVAEHAGWGRWISSLFAGNAK